MKRLQVLLGLSVVALLLVAFVATAQAGSPITPHQYNGTVEGDDYSYFGFDVKKANGKTRIKQISANLAYTCRGGDNGGYGYGTATGSLVAKHGKFSGKLTFRTFDARGGGLSPGSYMKVSGKVPKQGKARGHVDSLIKFPAMRGGTPQVCYTGELDWKVTNMPIRP